MDNGQPVFHRTFPGPEVEINSVDDDKVRISLEVQPNGNAMGRVYFKGLFMDLTMRYNQYRNSYYMNYDIFLPDDVCRRSTGHLGSCADNQVSVEPGVEERKYF